MRNFCAMLLALVCMSGAPDANGHGVDWLQRAIGAAHALGIAADPHHYEVDRTGSGATVTVLGDVEVTFFKDSGEILSVTDTKYYRTRIRSDEGRRLPVRPGQGWRFRRDSDWDKYCRGFVEKVLPGTVLEPAHSVARTGEKKGLGNIWSSSSNIVTVFWRTKPFHNLSRQVAVSVDQESGRFISIMQTRPARAGS